MRLYHVIHIVIPLCMFYFLFFHVSCMLSAIFYVFSVFRTSRFRFTPHVPAFTPHFSCLTLCMLHSRLTPASLCLTCTHCMISLLIHSLCVLSISKLLQLKIIFAALIYSNLSYFVLILWLNALINFF